MDNGNEENVEDMTLIAVHEVVDEVPYEAQIRSRKYVNPPTACPDATSTYENYCLRPSGGQKGSYPF